MRKLFAVIIGSLVLALLSVGVSYVGYIELVWVFAVGLFISGHEEEGLGVAVLSGFLFDVMMHGNVGFTSLSILVGIAVYVLAKWLGLFDRTWQKVGVVLMVYVVAYLVEFGLRNIVEHAGFDAEVLRFVGVGILINVTLTGIAVFVIKEIDRRVTTSGTVRI